MGGPASGGRRGGFWAPGSGLVGRGGRSGQKPLRLGAALACPEPGGARRILKAGNNLLIQNVIETTDLNVIILLLVTFLKVNYLFLNFQ